MELSYSDFRRFDDKMDAILKGQGDLRGMLRSVLHNQGKIMASIDQVNTDLDTILQESGDYIAQRDAIDADLRAQIQTLTDQLASGAASAAAVQAGIDTAFQKAEQAKANLAPPGGGDGGGTTAPPTPLDASYASADAFNTALQGYQGPEEVDLDGAAQRSGTTPALAYFTQADGSISTTNPNA